MMKEVVSDQTHASRTNRSHVGMPIKNVAGLSIEEKQKLIQWIEDGSPRGEGQDQLAALKFDEIPSFPWASQTLCWM